MQKISIQSNILLFLAVCLLCLIVFEIVSPFFLTVCITYKNCPNAEYFVGTIEFNMSVKLNSDGFRDDDFTSIRKDSVALIGDSYVFGWGVEENKTFAHLIEERAREEFRKGDNYILNLGIEGTSMREYINSLKEYGKKTDTVILVYNPPGDILMQNKQETWKNHVIKACHSLNSCTLAHKAYYKLANKDLGPSEIARSIIKRDLKKFNHVDQRLVNWALEGKISSYLIVDLEKPKLIEHYETIFKAFDSTSRNKEELDEFITWGKKRGKNVIIVLLPQNIAVSETYIEGLQNLGYLDSDTDLQSLVCDQKLHSKIKSFLNDYNVTIIDLQEEMCKSGQAGLFYYKWDWHLTTLGNEFVADAIFNALADQNNREKKGLNYFMLEQSVNKWG